MQKFTRSVVALVAIAGVTACHDTASPPTGRRDTQQTAERAGQLAARGPEVVPSMRRRVTATEFHAQNRMDWVGVTHNRVLDSLRAEIRLHRPRQLCKLAADIIARQHIEPRHTRGLGKDHVRRYLSLGAGSARCGNEASRSAEQGSMMHLAALGASPIGEEYDVSAEANALLEQIGAAVDGAASSAELAGALSSVGAAAQQLSADDAAAVDAVASVAQSSFEYWEQNGGAAAQDFGSAYGDCISTAGALGDCMGYLTSVPRRRDSSALVWSAALMTTGRAECRFGWKEVAKTDFAGAWAGLMAGAKLTKTIQGAIFGALGGATLTSSGAFLWEAGSYFWCLYHS